MSRKSTTEPSLRSRHDRAAEGWLFASQKVKSVVFRNNFQIPVSLLTLVVTVPLLACSPKADNPAAVREKAADATAQIKRDTKAIAQGIREGWTRDKTLDLNTATSEQLQSLPGVNQRVAEKIISHRPYTRVSELLEWHVLTKAEYDKIEYRLAVKH